MAADLLRCQKCGEQGLPSPTVVLDLESELRERRFDIQTLIGERDAALAEARHLTKENSILEKLSLGNIQCRLDAESRLLGLRDSVEALPNIDTNNCYFDSDFVAVVRKSDVLSLLAGSQPTTP